MKRYNFYILIIFVILMASVVTTLLYYYYNIYEVKRIDMRITVYDHYGFSLGTNDLDFGMTTPGDSGGSRTINLVHNYKNPLLVNIKAEGDIAPWVSFQNNFVLGPDIIKELGVNINVPYGVEYGNYTGELVIIFKKNF